MFIRVLAAFVVGLALAACAVPSDDPGSSTGDASASPTPPAGYDSPASAMAGYLAGRDLEYAGRCSETDLEDVGKYCSEVVEDRGTAVVAKVGTTFSEYESYLLIQRTDTGWAVVRSAGIPYPEDDGTLPF